MRDKLIPVKPPTCGQRDLERAAMRRMALHVALVIAACFAFGVAMALLVLSAAAQAGGLR